MMQEADSHADEAHRMRELAEASNHAETLLYTTEKTLKEHRDALDDDTTSLIESRTDDLRSVLEGDDVGEIPRSPSRLTEASHKLAQAVYEKAQAQGAASGAQTGTEAAGRGRGRRGGRVRGPRRGGSEDVTERAQASRSSARGLRTRSELEELEARVADAEAKRDEYLEDLQRVAADFDNYRKRVARDQETLVARAHERLVQELLPVLDDLERALEAVVQHEEAKLEEGVHLVERELRHALDREGLGEIETDGKFDPHIHEALLTQPSERRRRRDPRGPAEGLPAGRPSATARAGRHRGEPQTAGAGESKEV